jgi:phosphate starvation-inducible protein PhoH and related proteins
MQRHTNRKSRQERREEKRVKGRQVAPKAFEELKKPVRPKNRFQEKLLSLVNNKDAVFVNAPAGTGKTFIIMSTVIDWLKQGKIDKIVLSRPTLGMGNSLGLLPGTVREKFEPYLQPMIQVIQQRYGHGFFETQVGCGNIEFVPLEYIRGRSFENAVVIIDEFQNTDEDTAYTIMTRLAEGSKLVCLGDISQNDMRNRETGLEWAIEFIDRHNLFDFADFVETTSDEIVRGGFCKAVVKARERDLGGR